MTTTETPSAGLWDGIPGQERAIGLLRRAAAAPVHAYLLAGPQGSGTLDAARRLAAALVCSSGGCGDCRACRRAVTGGHPDVIEVEPDGTFIVVGQVEEIIREAFRSPFEAERKVIIVAEAERMNEASANKVLKTLEEPADRTHFVLLSEAPEELLPTVRSRCQRIDFEAIADEHVIAALTADGIDAAEARAVTRLSAGRIERARALAGRLAPLRRETAAVVRVLDGKGATVAGAAQTLAEAVAAATAALEATQKEAAKALEVEVAASGYPERVAKRMRTALEQRQTREARRAKSDALLEVVTGLESAYRDVLIAHPDARVTPGAGVTPEAAGAALDACRATRAVLVNRTAVNESLLLEHLLLRLGRSL